MVSQTLLVDDLQYVMSISLQAVALHELPIDIRRMLRIQFKEFIHWLDEENNERVDVEPFLIRNDWPFTGCCPVWG